MRHRLRRGSRQETVKALAYVPPTDVDTPGSSGRVWLYVARVFGPDRFLVYDLSSGVEQAVERPRGVGMVTTMHLDFRGIMWTGHRCGAIW